MIELAQSTWPGITKEHLIVATFGFFVVAIFGFAVAHYWLYRRSPGRFWIAAEIAQKQAESTILRLQCDGLVLTTEIDGIAEARKAAAEGKLTDLPRRLPSGRRVDGGFYRDRLPDGSVDEGVWLSVTGEDGHLLCMLDDYGDREFTPSYLVKWLGEALDHRQKLRKDLKRRIEELERDPHKSLQFWDFVYFSGVSQTTVGYGDILPNATSIRLLVLSQILFGYALLIVLLNLVLTG